MEEIESVSSDNAQKPKYSYGFGFRLFFASVMTLVAVIMFGLMIGFTVDYDAMAETFLIAFGTPGIILTLFAVLGFIGAVKGRTCKWGNRLSIAIGAITAPAFFGIFAIVGGVNGNKAIDNREHEASSISNEKEVTRYCLHRYSVNAVKIWAVLYFAFPGSFIFTPLYTAGMCKYRKRFVVFLVGFLFFLAVFGVFFGLWFSVLNNDCYHQAYELREEYGDRLWFASKAASYDNYIKTREEFDAEASELSVYYDKALSLYEEINNEDRSQFNEWKDKYIAEYNELVELSEGELDTAKFYLSGFNDTENRYSVLELFELQDTDNYGFDLDYGFYVNDYRIERHKLDLEKIDDNIDYSSLLRLYQNLSYKISDRTDQTEYYIDHEESYFAKYGISANTESVYDESFKKYTLELYNTLNLLSAEDYYMDVLEIVYMAIWAGAIFGLGVFGVCSFIAMFVYVHNNQYIERVEKETLASGGTAALDEFRKNLIEKSKARDVDGFVAAVASAHDNYETRKDVILDGKTFRKKLNAATATVAANDGAESARTFGAQCKELFDSYEFEALDALFGSVMPCEVTDSAMNDGVLDDSDVVTEQNNALSSDNVSHTPAEYIKPQASPRAQKGIMIVMSVIYGLLLLAGILLASVPDLSGVLSGMGICEEIAARAYGITIGVMFVALTPSVGYYFALLAPFDLNKKYKIIIVAVSFALCVVMTVVFFIIINCVTIEVLLPIPVKEFFEGSDTWFVPTSMVFAQLGIAICYALLQFKINPEKIKDVKPQKQGDGVAASIKYVLMSVGGAILKGLKAMLKFKERHPEIFILIATVLLTWLAFFTSFIVAIVIIAALVAVIIMMFCGLVEYCYMPSAPRNRMIVEDEYGQRTEIEESPYEVGHDRYESVYRDSTGKKYYRENGKNEVYTDDD